MTERSIELTRRTIIASMGAVGAAGAGAGLGTSALFSDTEEFENNTVRAGELDTVVDYYTSRNQGSSGSASQRGAVNGDGGTEYTYDVADVKPGDSGILAFCPKIVDNPGWLWVGSVDGVTDYENGQTGPESQVDTTAGGSLDNGTNDGASAGELSDAIEVTVSYAESVNYDSANDDITCTNTRELDNPDGYTLADLARNLASGFQLDGNEPNGGDSTIDAYPGSSDADDQQGPCLCIEWKVPNDVGNEIQSDALELSFQFVAEQKRNNPDPDSPFGKTFLDSPQYYDSGTHPSAIKPKYVEKRGQYAFVVFQANPGYIGTYDVSDPTNPTLVDTVNTAPNTRMNGGYALTLDSNTLYVCQNGGSFTAVDISDPTNMSLRSREFTGGQGFDIATKGEYVYIADTFGSLRVFDVSDPANPSQATTRSVPIGGVAVNNDELYATAFQNDEVLVYDITSPEAPSQIGTYSPNFSFPVPVDTSGDKVYVQKLGGTQIDVVDCTDPTSLSRIETISTPAQIPNGGAVRVTGGCLFLTTGATGNGHITIYELSDFSSPIEEYAVPGGPNIETGEVAGDYVYLPNYSDAELTTVKFR